MGPVTFAGFRPRVSVTWAGHPAGGHPAAGQRDPDL
jgi:hypothetical protein